MKTIAICTPEIIEKLSIFSINRFSFCNKEIMIGLLDINYPSYMLKRKNEVLVQIQAFSCNYRDRSIFLVNNDKCIELSESGKFIYAPLGSDFVAVVKKVGANVKHLKVGDRVIPNCHYYKPNKNSIEGIPSNYASQRLMIFQAKQLIKIPDCMPDEIAAAFSITAQTAYSMVRKASLKKGENVLITAGTSNTSLGVIKALQNKKVNIFVTSSNPENATKLLAWGAHTFIPLEAFVNNNIKDYTQNQLFDVVIDPYFDLYMNGLIEHINHYGRYIFCGLCEQYMELNKESFPFKENYKRLLLSSLAKNIAIISNCLGMTKDLKNALDDYTQKSFDIPLDSIYKDLEYISFLEKSFKSNSRFGKIVYKYSE